MVGLSSSVQVGLRKSFDPVDTAEVRLQNLKPLYWVHVPKCGTSFANILLLHKGICGDSTETLPAHIDSFQVMAPFWIKMQTQYCVGNVVPDFRKVAAHDPLMLLSDQDNLRGHGVIMLRQ